MEMVVEKSTKGYDVRAKLFRSGTLSLAHHHVTPTAATSWIAMATLALEDKENRNSGL